MQRWRMIWLHILIFYDFSSDTVAAASRAAYIWRYMLYVVDTPKSPGSNQRSQLMISQMNRATLTEIWRSDVFLLR